MPSPAPFEQDGKLLTGPVPLPIELLLPVGNEPARQAFTAIDPRLPEHLHAQRRHGRKLVGARQLLKRATAPRVRLGRSESSLSRQLLRIIKYFAERISTPSHSKPGPSQSMALLVEATDSEPQPW